MLRRTTLALPTLTLLTVAFSFMLLKATAASAEIAAFRTHRLSFHIDSRPDVGLRVYYNCDSVESQLESLLEQMGARNIDVRCTGGFDRNLPEIAWEADVDLRFDALKLVGSGTPGAIRAAFQDIRIHEWDSCYLLRQTFDEVKSDFVLKNVSGPNRCFSANDSFRLELSTLFP